MLQVGATEEEEDGLLGFCVMLCLYVWLSLNPMFLFVRDRQHTHFFFWCKVFYC
jgi:hypothetical protein